MRYKHTGGSPDASDFWKEVLEDFIPEAAGAYTSSLLASGPISLHLSLPRQSKLGHFKRSRRTDIPEISINRDLHPEQFLFTLIHEIAHWKAYLIHGPRIKAHGLQWKSIFQDLMTPLLDETVFSKEALDVLRLHMRSPKASSCADPMLDKMLDHEVGEPQLTLNDLAQGAAFLIKQKRRFVKGERKRTRYLCTEMPSGKRYLIPGGAKVIELEAEKNLL